MDAVSALRVLTLNKGSSSLKFGLYAGDTLIASGEIDAALAVLPMAMRTLLPQK